MLDEKTKRWETLQETAREPGIRVTICRRALAKKRRMVRLFHGVCITYARQTDARSYTMFPHQATSKPLSGLEDSPAEIPALPRANCKDAVSLLSGSVAVGG